MDYKLVLTVITLFGSALISFITVRVTQKFYGKELEDNKITISEMNKVLNSHSVDIAKLKVEVFTLQTTTVTKDEVNGLRSDMKHIEDNISKLGNKLDKLMEIMIKK